MSNLILRDLTSDASKLGINSMNDLTRSELSNTVGGSSKYKCEEKEKKEKREKYERDCRYKYEYEDECD